jgi:hypothetical protein
MAATMHARLETDLSDTEDFQYIFGLPTSNLITLGASLIGLVAIVWASFPLIESRTMSNPLVGVPFLVLIDALMTVMMTAVEFWPILAIAIVNVAMPLLLIGTYRLYLQLDESRESEKLPWSAIGRALVPFGIGFGLLCVTFLT